MTEILKSIIHNINTLKQIEVYFLDLFEKEKINLTQRKMFVFYVEEYKNHLYDEYYKNKEEEKSEEVYVEDREEQTLGDMLNIKKEEKTYSYENFKENVIFLLNAINKSVIVSSENKENKKTLTEIFVILSSRFKEKIV